ncbi:10375_t:CDS:2 [Rhizophagus irregularis]|nr:10375_t:CDS:2 [Rhizophagus irregularis]
MTLTVIKSHRYTLRPRQIVEQEREKRQYRCRKNLWELPLSLHTFYELLFPDFTAIDSDGEAIITNHLALRLILPDPETDSEAEDAEDVPPPMIMGTAEYHERFITTFRGFLRQDGDDNDNFISAFFNRKLA